MITPVVLLSALVSASTPEESGLKVHLDPVLDRAAEIAVAEIRSCITPAGFRPDSSDHYLGVWLADSVFTLDAYRYFGADCHERLRALVNRFAAAQDVDGTIPMVFWGKEGTLDYGGRYDLAQNRKQNRDMENAYLFVHANHVLWKDFGDEGFVRQRFPALGKALESLDRRADAGTGLILATYGPPNSDVCVDHAIAATTAHVYAGSASSYLQAVAERRHPVSGKGRREDSLACRCPGVSCATGWHSRGPGQNRACR